MAIFPWPDDWCVPEMQERVESFLRHLPISPEDKKQALMAWCECAGVQITCEKVERVTGLPCGEV